MATSEEDRDRVQRNWPSVTVRYTPDHPTGHPWQIKDARLEDDPTVSALQRVSIRPTNRAATNPGSDTLADWMLAGQADITSSYP